MLAGFTRTAEAALAVGLGHQCGPRPQSRQLEPAFCSAVPGVQEVSIGHALVADALELGYTETVRDYQRCIQRAYAPLIYAP